MIHRAGQAGEVCQALDLLTRSQQTLSGSWRAGARGAVHHGFDRTKGFLPQGKKNDQQEPVAAVTQWISGGFRLVA